MGICRIVFLLLSLTGCLAQAATESFVLAATEWNPRPAHGDLVLPLPCNTGITFRKILTPISESPIADRRIILGSEELLTATSEFVREAYISGGSGQGAATHFWLGKYEVTVGQYAAVLHGCDAYQKLAPALRRMPKTGLTMAEALHFTEQATVAVYKADKSIMLSDELGLSHFRLPTEIEWEYAVRGGIAVSDADFRAKNFPFDGLITSVAQVRRTGQVAVPRMTGLLNPNPLGLHDVLGNVAEIMSEPFRLTRGGRLGGKVGGLVARGGDISLGAEQMRSSSRMEYSPMTPDGELRRDNTIGMRLAIGQTIYTSIYTAEQIRRAWRDELMLSDQVAPSEDPHELAQRLEEGLVDPSLRRAVGMLRSLVEKERSQRHQAVERAARSAIGAGAVLIRSYRNDYRGYLHASLIVDQLEAARQASPNPNERQTYDRQLKTAKETVDIWAISLQTTLNALSGLILQQSEIPQNLLKSQLLVWQSENPSVHFQNLRQFAKWFVEEVEKYRTTQQVGTDALRQRLIHNVNQ